MASPAAFLTTRPLAHRGLHDGNVDVPENSQAAFRAAIENGYGIELDVQLSKDGVVFVFHDQDLKRLTGTDGQISETDARTMSRLTLFGTREHPPTLAQTLALIGGAVPLVIEMKSSSKRNAALARAVARDLAHYDGDAAVMSFDQTLLAAFRETGSPRPMGLTAEGLKPAQIANHMKAHDLGIVFASYNVKELPNPFVEDMRKSRKLPVITWTVRTPDDVAATRAHADQMTFEGFRP